MSVLAFGCIMRCTGKELLSLSEAETSERNNATLTVQGNCGRSSLKMHLKPYLPDLLKELRDPDYAAGYLKHCLAFGEPEVFQLALRDVVEANLGKRTHAYKTLSNGKIPSIDTVMKILRSLNLSVTFAPKNAVEKLDVR